MTRDLIAAAPPYVFVADGAFASQIADNPAIANGVSAIRSWLGHRYEVLRTDVGGAWYVARDLASSGDA
jgi:hypothetical protein